MCSWRNLLHKIKYMAVDSRVSSRDKHVVPSASSRTSSSSSAGVGRGSVCLYLVVFVWVFLSAVVLMVLGITYAPRIRVLLYTRSTCMVVSGKYNMQYACDCGPGCRSLYPCYVVYVRGNWTDASFETIPLYEDDKQQTRADEGSKDHKERCSSFKCDEDQRINRKYVSKFKEQYGIKGLMVDCYFDPRNLIAGAILKKTQSWTLAFHVLFWPSLCLLLGSTVCIFLCRTNNTKKKCKHRQKIIREEPCAPIKYSTKCHFQNKINPPQTSVLKNSV